VEASAVEPVAMAAAVRLLRLFDSLSLALAGGLPWIERFGPVTVGSELATLALVRTDDGATVSPWPFASAMVQAVLPARCLPEDRFADGRTLARRLAVAPTIRLAWRLQPG
jgi:hypothetical protein